MPELDLSKIKDGQLYAVHCPTEEEADLFVSYMKTHYPEKCILWTEGESNWDWYEDETVYYPHFESDDGRMMYGCISGYSAKGHTIVKCAELFVCNELPVEHSDKTIDFLFGV